MALSIVNNFDPTYYKKLSDYLKGNICSIEIIEKSALEKPIDFLGPLKAISSSGNRFAVGAEIAINSAYAENIEEYLEAAQEELQKDYSLKKDKSGLQVSPHMSGNGFVIREDKNNLLLRSGNERKINTKDLENELNNSIEILLQIARSIYSTEGVDLSCELYTKRTQFQKKVKDTPKVKCNESCSESERRIKNIPETHFEDIGGCEEAKNSLQLLAYGLKYPAVYEKWGYDFPKGLLLHGPPGTGKTLLAKAAAHEAEASFFIINLAQITSYWYGQSEKNLKQIFDSARKESPSIILFDELDGLLTNRRYSGGVENRIVSTMLSNMDGLNSLEKVCVIGTTNFLDNLDPALLRPGRFTEIIEVALPDEASREQIYKLQCKGNRIDECIDYRKLAKMSANLSGADIYGVVQKAIKGNMENDILGKEDRPVSTEDLIRSLNTYLGKSMKKGIADYNLMYA